MFSFANNHFSAFFLIISFPFSLSFYLPDSNPLFSFSSQVREGHLYTDNHRRGVYMQISQDGRVSGSDARTPYSVLQLKSVQPGHVIIKGQSSSLYLCVDGRGHLRGQSQYSEADCTFRELLLADGYTRFISSHYGFPISLASRHSPDQPSVPFTRFLPLRNTVAVETVSVPPPDRSFNVDSDDLLGMGLQSVVSPHFSAEK
ncbi:fibroblast growth factor 21 [Salarias fasciatus]|uniref:fibroblast growth factor 21 n=1 Tax=Salarias fasciatus TaxID=181472 RepID=UPI001176C16C|nr:fibroblast growth factor 21-like [Salarias fasciatus]